MEKTTLGSRTHLRRPNILLITCHDLGRHLGCYGIETVRTPHLDGLAGDGVRFERVYCVAPGCSPSRAALATGRYPHSNGVMGLAHEPFGWDLAPGERHIAELLCASGYESHLFGLQHVTTRVERLGFTYVHERGLAPVVSAQVASFMHGPRPAVPLYIEVNLEEPHRPYDQGGVEPDVSQGVTVPEYLPNNAEAREEMAALQGAIHQADQAVGVILAGLHDSALADTTWVVFTTDHGIAMPRAKCTLYDPGIEVALIIRPPDGNILGERVATEMISNIDLLPTLLAAVDMPVPAQVQGRSFLPLLRGEPYSARDAVYAEKTYHSYYDPMRAIRTDRYKLIRNFETAFAVEVPGDVQKGSTFRSSVERYSGEVHPGIELYDLAADPPEEHNMAEDAGLIELRRELHEQLLGWMRETEDPLLLGPVPSPAHLRSLSHRGLP